MKAQARIFFTVTLALILSACGSSPTQESSPTEGASLLATTPTLTSTTLPTATPTSVPTILPTPLSIVPFDDRLLATVTILKEPDELVFVQGFIWTKTADGHVVQVDPATNLVVGDIKVDTTTDIPFHYCQGLGTDGENIWACSASGDADHRSIDVVRIDPESQSIVETVKVEKFFDQLYMPFLHNQIWVLSGNGDKLVGIDVTTNELSPAIDLGVRCFQLAVVNNALMATCALDNLVLQIDPELREVTAQVTMKSPRFVAGNDQGIWVVQDTAVTRLDPESLQPVVVFSQLAKVSDVIVMEEAVWLRQEIGFLYRIDPASNQIVEQIKVDQALSGGSVLITSDSIWVTAYNNNLLVRLSLK